MLPVCIYLIPYLDEKQWRSDITEVDFENNNVDTSLLGGGTKMIGLNRDTVLFNKSKSLLFNSPFLHEKSFKDKSALEKDKSFMEKCKKADQNF